MNQIEGEQPAEPNSAVPVRCVEIAARRGRTKLGGVSRKNDDGELEAFGFVDRHHADAVTALFEKWALRQLAVFVLLAKLIDKPRKKAAVAS